MRRRRLLACCLALVAGGLAGCGRKGDLELPPAEPMPEAAVEDDGP